MLWRGTGRAHMACPPASLRFAFILVGSLAACAPVVAVLPDTSGDAGTDAGRTDVDAGEVDAGEPDAGSSGGGVDAGGPDAGASDGGVDAGEDAGQHDAGLPGPTLSEFCAQYPALACTHRFDCGLYAAPDSPVCLADEGKVIGRLCTAADAGALVFDSPQARACIAQMEQPLACGPWWAPSALAACANLLGRAPEDPESQGFSVLGGVFSRSGRCGASLCGAGSWCDRDCFSPTCRPERQPGESCSQTSRPLLRCAAGSNCTTVDGGLVCVALPSAGEACPAAACAPSAYCSGTGLCQATHAAGQACASPLECADGVCRGDGLCGARALGAACASPLDCGGFLGARICRGLTLEADGGVATPGVCAPRVALGQPCEAAWGFGNPLSDACDRSRGEGCVGGVCRRLDAFAAAPDAGCVFSNRDDLPYYGFFPCQPGFYCGPRGTCVTALPLGAPCTLPNSCASGLACQQGTCGRLAGLTEPCSPGTCQWDLQCLPGTPNTCAPRGVADGGCSLLSYPACEADSICDGTTCQPLRPAGVTCASDFECAAGVCAAGQCVAACVW